MRNLPAASASYRPDIDGLRALAVIPVIFYHAGVPWFGGGFVGVDVFFVISGYLITSLIAGELDDGRFSLLRFYERRIRRIFPALFFIMACCAGFGWFVLAPDDYRRLGGSIVAASLFSSNLLFWRQTGYFDTSAAEKPLLHTWSLAVEEQFYLLFPLYLILLARFLPNRRLAVTAAFCLLSLLLSAIAVALKPWAAFYLAPARAWELAIGSLLAMGAVPPAPNKEAWRDAALLLGLALIAAAVFGYTKAMPFPGFAALPPTVGTALVIWAGARPTPLSRRLMAARPTVFTGKISYSLYLWHYPLFAFASYLSLDGVGPAATSGLLAALPLLAVLTWRFVEQPFRRHTRKLWRRRTVFAAALAAIVTSIGWGTVDMSREGFVDRDSAQQVEQTAEAADRDPDRDRCFDKFVANVAAKDDLCRIGASERGVATFLLWGDSHAETLRPALALAADQHATFGYFAGWPDCPPLSGIVNLKEKVCDASNESIFRLLEQHRSIKTIILSARWSWASEGRRYGSENTDDRLELVLPASATAPAGADNHKAFAYGLAQTLRRLAALGETVWIVGPIPEASYSVPKALYLQSLGLYGDRPVAPTTDAFYARQRFVFATFHDLATRYPVHFIWAHEAFCRDGACDVQRGGRPLYLDNNHLSMFGAMSIAHAFDVVFKAPQS